LIISIYILVYKAIVQHYCRLTTFYWRYYILNQFQNKLYATYFLVLFVVCFCVAVNPDVQNNTLTSLTMVRCSYLRLILYITK